MRCAGPGPAGGLGPLNSLLWHGAADRSEALLEDAMVSPARLAHALAM